MQPPPELEGKTTRPALIGVVVLLAAFAFWKLGAPPLPGGEPSPTPSPDPLEAGGFADGSGVGERTVPASLAPTVASAGAADGRLSMLVYGDDQALGPGGGWPARAAAVLQDRLRVAPAPWTGAQVDLELVARPDLSAADVTRDLLGREEAPELVLVAVGWADGRAGAPEDGEVAVDAARAWWLEELAALDTHRDVGEARGFYARPSEQPGLSPLRHLQHLDAAGAWGQQHGAAVLYLEQPIYEPRGDRLYFASTAMRPQPWISLVYGLEQQPDPGRLAGTTPPRLSPAGDALVGRFVGTGLVQAVISGR